jgi:D-sedoheptulose 7-phosphate isomerase
MEREKKTDLVSKIIESTVILKQQILQDSSFLERITEVADLMVKSLKGGGKVLFCGNGGSAADAQHLAAELSGRFYYDRPPLPAEALHVNTSYLTAVANDYGYDEVYARMVRGLGKPGDILIGLSTSGNSPNVLRAFEAARENGMTVIAFTGTTGGAMASLTDVLLNVPSGDTPRIQEVHIMIGHILCEMVESCIFPQQEGGQ